MALHPVVRQMLLCNGVGTGGSGPVSLDVRGLIHAIRSTPPGRYPVVHPELCVYLALTGGVGVGRGRVVVTEADTGLEVFRTAERPITHPPSRIEVSGAVFRILRCAFPRPGLYWVEFEHDGARIRREPLVLR